MSFGLPQGGALHGFSKFKQNRNINQDCAKRPNLGTGTLSIFYFLHKEEFTLCNASQINFCDPNDFH